MNVIKIKSFLAVDCLLIILVILNAAITKSQRRQYRAFDTIEKNMERSIVHCDLDTFFVSVERLQNSKLIGVPVLIGGSSDRGVVASCSYEAREFGVHSAMPMRLALRMCPEAVVVRGDHDRYSHYSGIVTQIIEEETPIVEKASIDEHYLDVSGMDRFFGCWKWTQELRQRIIRETGLPISFGLSVNKTVSKIATGTAKPCGEKQVQNGAEKGFLAPLSIRKIPMVGEKSFTLLRNMGISKIGTLQQMEVFTMQKVLGENGINIWRKANGLDDSLVVPFREQKSMSKENTFQQDTIDMDVLRRTLISMVDMLAFDLRKEQKLTSCVTLK
ncbi:DNA polymerase Y family protein, partial [Sphingobacterium multivorum]|uniref:DNA polymerase Y family protein n=1 Tax=Sphingobacterium multivorum TaxID=28454 RepID=UPI00289947F5